MKKEPLKDKAFQLYPSVETEGDVFWYDDVKSAVEGLIQEIEDLKNFYESKRNGFERVIFTAKRDTAFRILLKIKRWFPDVVRA